MGGDGELEAVGRGGEGDCKGDVEGGAGEGMMKTIYLTVVVLVVAVIWRAKKS